MPSYFFLEVKVAGKVVKKAFLGNSLNEAINAALSSGAKLVFAPSL